MDYKSVPSVSFERVMELKAKRNSSDPNVAPLTDLEQASVDRYYFDQSVPEDLQLERRCEVWDVHYKLGKERFNNVRYEVGRSQGVVTLADMITDRRGSMFHVAPRLQATVIEVICKALGMANIVEVQTVSREMFDAVTASEQWKTIKKDAWRAFQIQEAKKETTWIHACVEKWVGGSFTPDKRKRSKGKDVGGHTLRPIDEVLIGNVKPMKSRRVKAMELTEKLGEGI
jgi:hypothetical protein